MDGWEELCPITRRGQAGFGEKQKELAETRHGTMGGKGPRHPKASCWDAGDTDRGEGTKGEMDEELLSQHRGERLCWIQQGPIQATADPLPNKPQNTLPTDGGAGRVLCVPTPSHSPGPRQDQDVESLPLGRAALYA